MSFSDSAYIICVLYRQTGISFSLQSLKCLRLLSLLISIRGKPGLITGNTVLLIMSMSIASKCSGGRFSSHLHWCKSRVIELFQSESGRAALIGFSVSVKILLNSPVTLFCHCFPLILCWYAVFSFGSERSPRRGQREGHLGRNYGWVPVLGPHVCEQGLPQLLLNQIVSSKSRTCLLALIKPKPRGRR